MCLEGPEGLNPPLGTSYDLGRFTNHTFDAWPNDRFREHVQGLDAIVQVSVRKALEVKICQVRCCSKDGGILNKTQVTQEGEKQLSMLSSTSKQG